MEVSVGRNETEFIFTVYGRVNENHNYSMEKVKMSILSIFPYNVWRKSESFVEYPIVNSVSDRDLGQRK